jgi:hypothetical protein
MRRDFNIKKSQQREIKMTSNVVESKKIYKRNPKHKSDLFKI